ncbi:MAG: ferredoxin--NADP reductase [Candidatus Berkiellales bacterium]
MKWVQAKVVSQKQWSSRLFSLFVEATIAPFIAGQFIQVAMDQNGPFRPYSLVNAPFDPILEFYFTLLPPGVLTPQLSQLSMGSLLWVANHAAGKFTLHEIPAAKTLWLFATGSGLGPFLSMLKTAEPWQRFTNIVLVHSVRAANELSHQPLIKEWQAQHPTQFHWFPIVTQEASLINSHVLSERITTLLQSGKLERLAQLELNPTTSQVMLCGSPSMVADVCETLQKRNLVIHRPRQIGHITVENYWKLSS